MSSGLSLPNVEHFLAELPLPAGLFTRSGSPVYANSRLREKLFRTQDAQSKGVDCVDLPSLTAAKLFPGISWSQVVLNAVNLSGFDTEVLLRIPAFSETGPLCMARIYVSIDVSTQNAIVIFSCFRQPSDSDSGIAPPEQVLVPARVLSESTGTGGSADAAALGKSAPATAARNHAVPELVMTGFELYNNIPDAVVVIDRTRQRTLFLNHTAVSLLHVPCTGCFELNVAFRDPTFVEGLVSFLALDFSRFDTLFGPRELLFRGAKFSVTLSYPQKNDVAVVCMRQMDFFESDKHFLQVAKNFWHGTVNGAVILEDHSLRILDINSTMCHMLDSTKEELLGHGIVRLVVGTLNFHTGEWNDYENRSPLDDCQHMFAGQDVVKDLDVRYRLRSGREVIVRWNCRRIPDLGIWTAVCSDVSKVLSLEREQDMLRKFWTNSSESFVVANQQTYSVVFCNQSLANTIGYPIEEIRNGSFLRFVVDSDVEMTKQYGIDKPSYRENRVRRKDGSVIWMSWTSVGTSEAKDRDSAGARIGVSSSLSAEPVYEYVIGRDITAQKEDEIRKNKQLATRDAFLSAIGEEVRTPIHAIRGSVELLSLEEPAMQLPYVRQHVSHVSSAADEILLIFENLIAFAKLASGTLSVLNEVVDIRTMIRQALNLARNVHARYSEADVASGEVISKILTDPSPASPASSLQGSFCTEVSRQEDSSPDAALRPALAGKRLGLCRSSESDCDSEPSIRDTETGNDSDGLQQLEAQDPVPPVRVQCVISPDVPDRIRVDGSRLGLCLANVLSVAFRSSKSRLVEIAVHVAPCASDESAGPTQLEPSSPADEAAEKMNLQISIRDDGFGLSQLELEHLEVLGSTLQNVSIDHGRAADPRPDAVAPNVAGQQFPQQDPASFSSDSAPPMSATTSVGSKHGSFRNLSLSTNNVASASASAATASNVAASAASFVANQPAFSSSAGRSSFGLTPGNTGKTASPLSPPVSQFSSSTASSPSPGYASEEKCDGDVPLHQKRSFSFGLSLVVWMVQRLGGNVFIDSSEDEGTLVRIEIPVTALPPPASFTVDAAIGLQHPDVGRRLENEFQSEASKRGHEKKPSSKRQSNAPQPSGRSQQRSTSSSSGTSSSSSAGNSSSPAAPSPRVVPSLSLSCSSAFSAAPSLVLPSAVASNKSRPVRVLCAEDDPINQKVLGAMLRKLGLQPSVHYILVDDGQKAVNVFSDSLDQVLMSRKSSSVPALKVAGSPTTAMAASNNALSPLTFDVVLLDLQMPVMGGLEACNNIRTLHRDKAASVGSIVRPYIAAVTASALEEDRIAAQNSGFDCFLSKPVLLEQLVNVIREGTQGRYHPPSALRRHSPHGGSKH
eukprot:ANDGO_07748.mRNA.1 Histidine kinase 1